MTIWGFWPKYVEIPIIFLSACSLLCVFVTRFRSYRSDLHRRRVDVWNWSNDNKYLKCEMRYCTDCSCWMRNRNVISYQFLCVSFAFALKVFVLICITAILSTIRRKRPVWENRKPWWVKLDRNIENLLHDLNCDRFERPFDHIRSRRDCRVILIMGKYWTPIPPK